MKESHKFQAKDTFDKPNTTQHDLARYFGKNLDSEMLLHAILQQSTAGILVIDQQGAILFSNEAAQQLIGSESFSPQAMLRVKTSQEMRLTRPDGTHVDLLVSCSPLRSREQEIFGSLIVCQEHQPESSSTVQYSSDPVIDRTLNGTIFAWSAGAERVYGYTPEEVIGQPITMLLSPDYLDEHKRAVAALLRNQPFVSFDTQRVCKDGSVLDISLTASPIRNEQGALIGVSTVDQNIVGTRKRPEEELADRRRIEQALQVAHNRFQRIADAGMIGVTISKADGTILEANDYYLDMLGYTRAEFEEGLLQWRKLTPPEYIPADDHAIAELVEYGTSKAFEKEYYHKDGHRVPVMLFTAALPEEDDAIIAFVLDMSRQKHDEETILAQANLLEQTNDAIFVWDWGSHAVNWYEGAARLYGWSREDAVGSGNIHELLRSNSPVSWEEIENAIRTYGEWSGELTQVTKNGRNITVESHMKLVPYGHDRQLVLEVNRDVTERKWVEQIAAQTYAKVLDQQRKLKATLAALPVGVVITDQNGVFTETNEQFIQMWGLPQGYGFGRRTDYHGWWSESGTPLSPEDWPVARAVLKGEVITGEMIEIERFDGSRAAILISAAPIRNDQGDIVGGVSVMADMTDRKEMEEALRESEERYRTLFENTPTTIAVHEMVYDDQGQIIDWIFRDVNPQWERILELSASDVIGRRLAEIFDPKVAEGALAHARDVMASGRSLQFESQTPGGKYQILAAAFPLYKDMYVISSQDITDLKRAERALRESEERQRNVLEHIPVMLIAFDEQLQFLVWNKECERVTGYRAEEIIGNPNALSLLFPDAAYREKMIVEWQVFGSDYRNFEVTFTAKDGTLRQTSWGSISRSFPVPGWAGWAAGIDITERKLAEQQQLELRAQRERMQIMSDFVRDVSHDFKTPISTINTSLYLLQRLADPAEQQHHVSVIQRQAFRLSDLIEGLLTMTRLDNATRLNIQRLNANPIAAEVETFIWDAADLKQVRLQVELAEEPLWIEAERQELQRALVELAENAVQFTPEGGLVTVRTSRRGDQAAIEVCDTGIGISEEDLSQIFNRLYRVDQSRATDTGGVGLGLSIAQKIVDLHGGTIEASSVPGEGSIFRVLLPLAE